MLELFWYECCEERCPIGWQCKGQSWQCEPQAPRAWKAHGLIIVRAQPTGKAAWPGWLASQSLKGSKFKSLRFLLPHPNQKTGRRRWAPQRSLITRVKLTQVKLDLTHIKLNLAHVSQVKLDPTQNPGTSLHGLVLIQKQ
jgi:hypothetical protein